MKKTDYSNPDVILTLCGEISEAKVEEFMELFIAADSERRPGGIVIRITSSGGDIESGFAIYDAINLAHNHVTTETWGWSASMAVAVFEAGHKRMMAPNSRLMVHDTQLQMLITSGSRGVESILKSTKALEKAYIDILSKRSNASPALVKYWLTKSEPFSAEEAVTAGLADGIIQAPKRIDGRLARV